MTPMPFESVYGKFACKVPVILTWGGWTAAPTKDRISDRKADNERARRLLSRKTNPALTTAYQGGLTRGRGPANNVLRSIRCLIDTPLAARFYFAPLAFVKIFDFFWCGLKFNKPHRHIVTSTDGMLWKGFQVSPSLFYFACSLTCFNTAQLFKA